MTSPNPKVAAVPKGFRSITASLAVADIQAAIDFYSNAFNAETSEVLTAPDSDEVIHAQIKIGGTALLLVLDRTALPTAGTGHVSLHHYLDQIEDTFAAAIKGGAVAISPITPTWWGDLNAVLVDPFGMRWNLAKRVERLTPAERELRLRQAFRADLPESEPAEIAETAQPETTMQETTVASHSDATDLAASPSTG